METKKIKKSITLNAPAKKVWNVMINDEYTSQWYEYFSPGTIAQTDWQPGSKVFFLDGTKNGIAGVIAVNEPDKLLDIEYKGFISEGKEDYESEMAKAFSGSHEVYTLTEINGNTTLDVSVDMGADYYDMMSEAWDEALEKISELAKN